MPITKSKGILVSDLKRLRRNISELRYSDRNTNVLFLIDQYGVQNEGIDLFTKYDPISGLPLDKDSVPNKLRSQMFAGYLIEMFIVFAAGTKEIFLDHPRYIRSGHHFRKNKHIRTSTLHNQFFNLSRPRKNGGLSTLANLMLPTAFEQFDIQITYIPDYARFYEIYASNNEVNQIFLARIGLSLKKYIGFSWAIYTYVNSEKTRTFTINDLVDYLSDANITKEEIQVFLNMISLERDKFREKYLGFRKKKDGSYFPYEDLETFDRGLPKISHFYPLLKEGEHYHFISNSSYHEFMKMRSVYRTMTEGFEDMNFKSNYVGPLFEEYVRKLLTRYNNENHLEAEVYGDEEYEVQKGKGKKEPDAILETDDYIVIIECKSTPFSLNLLKYSSSEYLNKLKESVKTSAKNIENFLNYRYTGKNKDIVKILVFHEANQLVFSILGTDTDLMVETDNFYIMDAYTLELMLSEYTQPIPEILSEYTALITENPGATNLHTFISSKLSENRVLEHDEHILKDIMDEMGLEH